MLEAMGVEWVSAEALTGLTDASKVCPYFLPISSGSAAVVQMADT